MSFPFPIVAPPDDQFCTMPRPPLGDGLIIDYFAGGGGTSTGFEMALGRSPDIAKNHDAEALFMHEVNHPETWHICSNVWKGDPRAEVAEASRRRCLKLGITYRVLPVDVFWASPDCKHFSKAKGSKPVEKGIRDLAWVVVHVARLVRPTVIMLENVEEFRDWGPLIETSDGKLVPCPLNKGLTFKRWKRELQKLGYVVEYQERRASIDGTPTIRKRLYVIARCDGLPIEWPAATHAKDGAGGLLPFRTAADCIDWSIPCPSIFGRERPLAENTLRRIAQGILRYVINCADPFIVPRYGEREGQAPRTSSTREPLNTITPDANVGSLVEPVLRPWNSLWCEGAPAPDSPADCPYREAAAALVPFLMPLNHQGGERGQAPTEPARTITGAHRGEYAMVAPVIARIGQTGGNGKYANGAGEGLTTITSKAEHLLVGAHLVGVGGRAGQSPPRSAGDTTGTTTSKADVALVVPVLVGAGGPAYSGKPVCAGQPFGAQTTENHRALAVAHITKFRKGSKGASAKAQMPTVTANSFKKRPGGAVPIGVVETLLAPSIMTNTTGHPGAPATEPVATLATGGHQAVVAAFLAKHYGGHESPGWPPSKPISSLTSKDHHHLVAANLVSLKGSSRRARSMKEPSPAVTAQGWHIAEVRSFLIKYYSAAEHGQTLKEPLHSATSKARFGIVYVHGEPYQIVDIGMRMLTPRELYRAQGFPETYVIAPWMENRIGKNGQKLKPGPLPATAQVRMVGNSVCPPTAAALIRANVGKYYEMRAAA